MRPLSFIACTSCALLALLGSAVPAAAAETSYPHPPRQLAEAAATDAGLQYLLAIDYDEDARLYDIVLSITCLDTMPLGLEYPTMERFDFVVYAAKETYYANREQLWHYNYARFFVQQQLTDPLYFGDRREFRGQWDGCRDDGTPIEAAEVSLEAVHTSSSHPMKLWINHLPVVRAKLAKGEPESAEQQWQVVPPDHWAYGALSYLIDIGVLPGYALSYFSGEHVLYRYDFAIAVARALGYAAQHPQTEQINIMLETLRAEFSEQLVQLATEADMPNAPAAALPDATAEDASTSAPHYSAYDDVPAGHWAYAVLAALSAQGALEGYPDGFFNGERTLTRYEFAQATARLIDKLHSQQAASDPLVLALARALQLEFAAQLAEVSHVFLEKGQSIADVLPWLEPIPPAEASELPPAAGAEPPASDLRAWEDVPTDHWAYAAVKALLEQGWLEGYPDRYFDGRTFTRYEFALATATLLDKLREKPVASDPIVSALAKALQAEFADQLARINIHKQEHSEPFIWDGYPQRMESQ